MDLSTFSDMFANALTFGARHTAAAGEMKSGSVANVAKAVEGSLKDLPCLEGASVRCEVTDGRVVLHGYVCTYSMKHTVRVLVESLVADHGIEDRLDVIPVPPQWERNETRSRDESSQGVL